VSVSGQLRLRPAWRERLAGGAVRAWSRGPGGRTNSAGGCHGQGVERTTKAVCGWSNDRDGGVTAQSGRRWTRRSNAVRSLVGICPASPRRNQRRGKLGGSAGSEISSARRAGGAEGWGNCNPDAPDDGGVECHPDWPSGPRLTRAGDADRTDPARLILRQPVGSLANCRADRGQSDGPIIVAGCESNAQLVTHQQGRHGTRCIATVVGC
jgi:hypothetical protein